MKKTINKFLRECVFDEMDELAAESGQGDIQIEQAIGHVLGKSGEITILDYGCAKGRLLFGLSTLGDKDKERINYIGINYTYPTEAEANAQKYKIKAKFYAADDFEHQEINADIIFMINVLHELPLKDLPKQIYFVLRALDLGGCIFIHEMLQLPHGEASFFNWSSEEIVDLFCPNSFDIVKRPIHYSKSGVPLTTIIATKRVALTINVTAIADKCLQIYLNRKREIISAIETIYQKHDRTDDDVLLLEYQQTQNANIDRQIAKADSERRQLKEIDEEINNPYDFDHPALGDLFFGRKVELSRLKRSLQEGRSVVVYGLQRIGKTSLVEKSLDGFSDKNCLLIKLNMFDLAESCLTYANFFTIIIDAITEQLGLDLEQIDQAKSLYLRTTDQSELKNRLRLFFKGIRDKYGKKRIIIFFDEFQDIGKTFEYAIQKKVVNPVGPDLVRYLGNLIKDNIVQVIMCCRYHFIKMDMDHDLQILKLLSDVVLGALDNSSAELLITQPVDSIVRYDSDAVREIIILTGSHPYLIQYICYEIFEELRNAKLSTVTKEIVETTAKKITIEPTSEPKFRVLCDDFRLIDVDSWRLLLCIAKIATEIKQPVLYSEIVRTYNDAMNRNLKEKQLQNSMDYLKQSKVILEERKNGAIHYSILPDILRMWLRIHNYFEKTVSST